MNSRKVTNTPGKAVQDPCAAGLAGTTTPQCTHRDTGAPCCPALPLQCPSAETQHVVLHCWCCCSASCPKFYWSEACRNPNLISPPKNHWEISFSSKVSRPLSSSEMSRVSLVVGISKQLMWLKSQSREPAALPAQFALPVSIPRPADGASPRSKSRAVQTTAAAPSPSC